MSWYIRWGRKLWLSLFGSSNGYDCGCRLYVLRSLLKGRRTWWWRLRIIADL